MNNSLFDVQKQQKEWSERNFGPHPSWKPLLGVVEEVGELSHAILKRDQGIRGSRLEHDEAIRDAVGDIIIFLCDLCSCEGIDIERQVSITWEQVKKRDWKKNPKTGDSSC